MQLARRSGPASPAQGSDGQGRAHDRGDRGILEVRPHPRRGDLRGVRWICSNCGIEHAAASSWQLWHRDADGTESRSVVCPACAADLLPVRLTVHVPSLAAALDTAPWLEPVGALVSRVVDQRSQASFELRLRAADVVALSEQVGVGRSELVYRLDDAGVLVGL